MPPTSALPILHVSEAKGKYASLGSVVDRIWGALRWWAMDLTPLVASECGCLARYMVIDCSLGAFCSRDGCGSQMLYDRTLTLGEAESGSLGHGGDLWAGWIRL